LLKPRLIFSCSSDDDNILKSNFLETAITLADDWPFLGAFGGQSHPQWEKNTARVDLAAYWHLLGIREFLDDRWSNVLGGEQPVPIGAGMVVAVALQNAMPPCSQTIPHAQLSIVPPESSRVAAIQTSHS
jgi:hypothetical protein